MPEVKPKPKSRVRYEVCYTPELATKSFDFMSKLDLGIVGGKFPVCEIWSWTTTTKVDQAYRQKMRRVIRKALLASGITQIHSIKKVK